MAEEIAGIGIDPKGAIEGAKKVEKAFADIGKAMDRLAKIAGTASTKLEKASTAINSISGPKQTAITRLERLSSALGNLKVPTTTQIRNLNSLGRALDKFGTGRIHPSVVRTLSFLAGYSGPTAKSGANAAKLFAAISKFTPPKGLLETTRNLERMAVAANKAALAVSQLSGRFRGLTQGGSIVVRNTNRMGQNFEQLGRRAGFLENAIFRTGYALNAIGGILAARQIINTAAEVQSLDAAFTATTGSAAKATYQLEFVKRVSRELSIDFLTAARNYSLFLAATRGTQFSIQDTQYVFEKVSLAARVLNLSIQDTEGVFRALQQIISKGSLQSEELRQQLGDRLPGAFNRMASAIGVTTSELQDMLKKGEITGTKLRDALVGFAEDLERDMKPGLTKALNTVLASFSRLRNAFTFATSDLGKGGLNSLIIAVSDGLTKILESENFSTILEGLARGFKLLGQNIEVVAAILGGLAVKSFLSYIGSAIAATSANKGLGASFAFLLNTTKGVGAGFLALSSLGLSRLIIGFSSLLVSVRGASIGLAALTVASKLGAVAMASLRAALTGFAAALPGLIGLLTTVALVVATMGKSAKDNTRIWQDLGETLAIAGVYFENLSARIAANTEQIDNNTGAVYRNVNAQVALAQAKLANELGERRTISATNAGVFFTPQRESGLGGLIQYGLRTGGALLGQKTGTNINSLNEQATVNRIAMANPELRRLYNQQLQFEAQIREVQSRPNAFTKEARANIASMAAANLAALQRRGAAISDTKQRETFLTGIGKGGSVGFQDVVEKALSISLLEGVLERPDLNLPGTPNAENITDKDKDKKKGKGPGPINITRFTDMLNDLKLAQDLLKKISTSSGATNAFKIQIDAEAVQEGLQNLKDYQDLLVNADPARAADATARLNSAFAEQGIVTGSLADKFIALARAKSLTDRRTDVAGDVLNLKLENELLEKQLDYVGKGPGLVKQWEVEQQKLTTAMEKGLELSDPQIVALEEQLQRKRLLVREQEYLNKLEESNNAIQSARAQAEIYSAGGAPHEVEDRLRLAQKELELRRDAAAFSEIEISNLLRREVALINHERVLEEVRKEYEEQIQFAEDLADAIVDAFKQGSEAGQGFFKTLKDVFKAGKDIILDFYLYQPLKKGLTQLLTGNASGGALANLTEADRALLEQNGKIVTAIQSSSEVTERAAVKLEDAAHGIVTATQQISNGTFNVASATINVNSADLGSSVPPSALSNISSATVGSDGIPLVIPNLLLGALPFLNPAAPAAGNNDEIVVTGRRNPFQYNAGALPGPKFDPMKIIALGTKKGIIEGTRAPKSGFSRLLGVLGLNSEGAAAAKGRATALFGEKTANKLFGAGNPLATVGKKLLGEKGFAGLSKVLGKVGPALETAGAAFAAYTTGKQIGKALGLGKVGSGALGGAAAGFQVGGPIGAAVGAVVGGVLGFLKKSPSSKASVRTDASGQVILGSVSKRGKGSKENAQALATGGISIFTGFAELAEAALAPGIELGTFGQYKKKNFYAAPGTRIKKGKPKGVQGRDFVYGTEEQLQIFALKDAITRGAYNNLSQNYAKVALNSRAQTSADFSNDLTFVKTYEELIIAAEKLPDSLTELRDLTKTYDQAITKAKQLGLAEGALVSAREKLLKQAKDDFNKEVNQQILEFENPALAAFNLLKDEYEEAVRTAVFVGGDLVAVEKLYGLKREELLKQINEEALGGLRGQAKALLDELTASTNSPLSPIAAQQNAAARFRDIRSRIVSGLAFDPQELTEIANNYLDTSRAVFASSGGFFSVFDDVTGLLRAISSEGSTIPGIGGTPNIPGLPSAAAVLDATPIIEATNLVGEEIVKGNVTQSTLLTEILGALKSLVENTSGTAATAEGSAPSVGGSPLRLGTGGNPITSAFLSQFINQ